MDYIEDTRDAYKAKSKAEAYHKQYTTGFGWPRFTMWRQRVLVDRILKKCRFTENNRILDIPCGTGVIGRSLCGTPAFITACDISAEMMRRAEPEYTGEAFTGFVECDITEAPFTREAVDCVVVLALMHRLPKEIRDRVWKEIVRVTKRYIVVNYSYDSRAQRFKGWLLSKLRSGYIPAPSAVPMQDIVAEIGSFGLSILKKSRVAFFLSGKMCFLLEKKHS